MLKWCFIHQNIAIDCFLHVFRRALYRSYLTWKAEHGYLSIIVAIKNDYQSQLQWYVFWNFFPFPKLMFYLSFHRQIMWLFLKLCLASRYTLFFFLSLRSLLFSVAETFDFISYRRVDGTAAPVGCDAAGMSKVLDNGRYPSIMTTDCLLVAGRACVFIWVVSAIYKNTQLVEKTLDHLRHFVLTWHKTFQF